MPLKKCEICKRNHRMLSAFRRCANRNLPKDTWKLSDIGKTAKRKKKRSNKSSDIPAGFELIRKKDRRRK